MLRRIVAPVGVELQERFLQLRRLDRQVGDPDVADGGQERPHVAFELAGHPTVRLDTTPETPGDALERRRRRLDPHLDVALRRASSASTSSSATSRPRRMIATRSHTRSTSDRMCDEKKIVRPASAQGVEDLVEARCISGSSPSVGSSRIASSGSCWSAWMMPIFWRMPRE